MAKLFLFLSNHVEVQFGEHEFGLNARSVVNNQFGRTRQGKQRYGCQNKKCNKNTFLYDYTYNGHKQEVKAKILVSRHFLRNLLRRLQGEVGVVEIALRCT